jgi:hypothetical protein
MPAKKYDTIEQKEESYRISSKKCYWSKKGEDWQKKSEIKHMKRFVKLFLTTDENYQKVYELIKSIKI